MLPGESLAQGLIRSRARGSDECRSAIEIDIGHTQRQLGRAPAEGRAGEHGNAGLFEQSIAQIGAGADADLPQLPSEDAEVGKEVEGSIGRSQLKPRFL